LHERYQDRDATLYVTTLYVTTPCVALAHYGNSMGLPGVVFQSWNEFALEWRIDLEKKKLDASPIPPGFFEGLGVKVCQLVSKDRIDAHFAPEARDAAFDLYELLFCENGCHNGDGILEAEVLP